MLFKSNADLLLVAGAYLRIRDDGRKQQSMCASAFTADDTADMKPQVTVPGFHGSVIVTVNSETSRMPAGTGESVELEGIYHIIINFLRNRIAKIDRYSYHKHVCWVYECFLTRVFASLPIHRCLCDRKPNFGRGGSCHVYLQ